MEKYAGLFYTMCFFHDIVMSTFNLICTLAVVLRTIKSYCIMKYSQIAMGRKDVLRYSMMSLWRNGGNVANVEIIV